MKRLRIPVLVAIAVAGLLLIAGCTQAPPPAPTAAPAKPAATTAPAQPTAAPKAAEPTKPAAAPTAAPAAKKVDWPEKGKSITWIVGYAAGGPNDIVSRLLAPELEKILGVPIVVTNKPGASEQIASTELVKAKPDGYTVNLQGQPIIPIHYLDPETKGSVIYTRKDFAPVAVVEGHSSAVIVKGDSKYKTLKDIVDDAKANPEKVKWSTTGMMTTGAFPGYFLEEAAGIKLAFVHFDSGAQSMQAVLAGNADLGSVNPNIIMDHVRANNLRVIATTGTERNQFMPDVQTIREQGYDVVGMTYMGVSAPGATPKEIIGVLEGAIKTAMQNEEVKKKMLAAFSVPYFLDAAGYAKLWDQMEVDSKKVIKTVRGVTVP